MKCPLCGKEYEGIKICPSCNLPLIDTETKQAVSLQPEKKHKKNHFLDLLKRQEDSLGHFLLACCGLQLRIDADSL